MRYWTFKLKGKIISLNEWYSNTHWTVRYKKKKAFHYTFTKLLECYESFYVEKYTIELLYNSRHDPSNTITVIKLFEDFLVDKGIIKSDSKKNCKKITIEPDLELEHNTFIIKLIDYESLHKR